MTLEDFVAHHLPALEADEARHNLILAILGRALAEPGVGLRFWSLDSPGACAIQTPGKPVILGALDAPQCRRLAEMLRAAEIPGVVGPDQSAMLVSDRLEAMGLRFPERIPMEILALRGRPRHPGAPGSARAVTAADAALFAEWRIAFAQEATPHDPVPTPDELARSAASGDHLFWTVDGAPVSVASIGRRTRRGVVINGVYTPPALRSRGYAGAATAALVERGYAEGKSLACLYVDCRNPASNRSYAKIGFAPVCVSWHCVRG